jgi:hypothetical protein
MSEHDFYLHSKDFFLFYFLIATRWAAPLSSHAITNNDLALIFPTDKTNGASCLNS